ncbi:MAG: phosphotransferase [Gomphosphaeria aponina SAG 52.96 = DSM 107014]|uniref:Phosphotransferase n=1 Tax=Gomphosphaeria aponina SAG 52.96 = DSM 107014 TaxID=1521640 RepID=A0A941JNR8_9CHRO|nr:phosphotransferase [Gomphosphaeria aponina SAG 52.96 = DSM 107014]
MAFFLSTENVLDYLINQKLCSQEEKHLCQIKSKISKNFNLLITLPDRHYLVKQESNKKEGITKGDLYQEWQIHDFIKNHPELSSVSSLISEAIKFDADCSIIIYNYLHDYGDLRDFYAKTNVFPPTLATSLGKAIATIHRSTLDGETYKEFLNRDEIPDFIDDLEKITPEMFGELCRDAFKFFELYQRYPSLGKAVREVNASYQPCCLIHNDLKLNNILLQLNWEELSEQQNIIRVIDWEKWVWGDPAFDVGNILASYLRIWLNSLLIVKDLDIQTSLSLATTPLEKIQPSLVALIQAYLVDFPEILNRHPDFFKRVMEFTGLALIESILADISYHEPFDNNRICMLQVAKTLLCTPEQSIPVIFGKPRSELQ